MKVGLASMGIGAVIFVLRVLVAFVREAWGQMTNRCRSIWRSLFQKERQENLS